MERTECLEINPYIYSQLSSNKGAKKIKQGKKSLISSSGEAGYQHAGSQVGLCPYLTLDMKINSKSDTDSNVRPKTINSYIYICYIYIWINMLFILREREWASTQEGQRERENPKQAPHWQHRAWCRAQTQEPGDHDLSQNGVKHLTNWATKVGLKP